MLFKELLSYSRKESTQERRSRNAGTGQSFFKGDQMINDMANDPYRTTKGVQGMMNNVFYFIFAQKEPDYTSMIMSTYGCLMEQGKLQSRRMKDGAKTFSCYTQCFFNHFCYQHVVDDHNNIHMMDPCIEKRWSTMMWENRVCAFVLAISEVNAWLAGKHFLPHDRDAQNMTILNFRTQLAHEMMNDPFLHEPTIVNDRNERIEVVGQKRKSGRIAMETDHEFCTALVHPTKYLGNGKWILNDKQSHQRKQCTTRGCNQRARTSCSACSLGHWMCVNCWGIHMRAVGSNCSLTKANSASAS